MIKLFIQSLRKSNLKLLLVFCFGFSFCNAQTLNINQYNAVFNQPAINVPTNKTPDGPLAGNGDIGLIQGGTPNHLILYFGKNDFWRAYPVYPGGGIASPGGLSIEADALKGASYHAEQKMEEASVENIFVKDDLKFSLKTWVSATGNTVVAEFTSNKTTSIKLNLWTTEGNTSINNAGRSKNVIWASRSFKNTPLLEWPTEIMMAMKAVNNEIRKDNTLRLLPGVKTTVTITLYTNHDRKDWDKGTISEAQQMTLANVEQLRHDHENWWSDFWSQSNIQINDPFLEKYYYASQYLFACSSREGKFAPGIWGPFVTRDSSSWGGDYHLNYNYQAPYWASFSSNHIGLTKNFDQPLLDYMEQGKIHSKEILQNNGIYYPVGIGPKALCTTRWPLTPEEMERRYATRENTIDHGYKFLGQKINAVFGAGNMLMRFYSTYDEDYAKLVYPYLLACADFWEDYLKLENGRYVIYNDHYGEVMPNLKNQGQWRDQLGDFNSTLSLGLVKMLFKGVLDMSKFLNRDTDRRPKWEQINKLISDYPTSLKDGRQSLKSVEKSPNQRYDKIAGLSRVSIHGLILPGGVAGPLSTPDLNKILLNDVAHWKDRIEKPEEWGNTFGNGFETCFPGAVRVGYDADEILKYLRARIIAQSFPNLWITQAGGGIETLSGVPLTINEMLLQSYEGIIRIFPNWNHDRDASFNKLRAYGAFVISSELKKGKIKYVKLISEKGRTCQIKNPWLGKQVQIIRNAGKAEVMEGDLLSFSTKPNEIIELYEQ